MSLLDELDNKVNENFFQKRNWIRLDLHCFTGYIKTIFAMVKIPGVTDNIYLSFKVAYNSDSKLLTICSYEPDKILKREYQAIFDKVSIENPAESVIAAALNPEFLSSRFVRV